ncbi:MAG: DUF4362 domain-containing protein [Solobacterium sp.]|nr:DUF4362 domain-containing protein [Solobacterium sp.]
MKRSMIIALCTILCACTAPQSHVQEDLSGSQASADLTEETPETGTGKEFDAESYLLSLPKDPSERNDIVICSFSGIRHEDLWDSFFADAEAGKDASVTICNYTVEGDPIYTYLAFTYGQYTAVTDNSRDGFGIPEMVTATKRYMYDRQFEKEEEAAGGMRTYRYRYAFLTDQELDPDEDIETFLASDSEWVYLFGMSGPLD